MIIEIPESTTAHIRTDKDGSLIMLHATDERLVLNYTSGDYAHSIRFTIPVVEAVRLIRLLQGVVDDQYPGAYFPRETSEENSEGMRLLDMADRIDLKQKEQK